MVAISSKPDVKRVIRRGSRVAGRKAYVAARCAGPTGGRMVAPRIIARNVERAQ